MEVFTSHTLVNIKNQGFVDILIFSFLSQKADATAHIAFCVFEFIWTEYVYFWSSKLIVTWNDSEIY